MKRKEQSLLASGKVEEYGKFYEKNSILTDTEKHNLSEKRLRENFGHLPACRQKIT